MSTEEFMQELESYFVGFANDMSAKRFFQTANKLTAKSIDAVFEWLLCNVPATFKLDVKILNDALVKCCVSFKVTDKTCPCCGGIIKRNQSFCYSCGYDFSCKPEEFQRADKAAVEQVFSQLHLLRFENKKTG